MKPSNPIKKIMTTNLTTVRPDTPVATIQGLFKKNTFHHLPVVDAGSRLMGIISREDYFRLFNTLAKNTSGHTWTQREFDRMQAKDIMTEYPMTLDPDDQIGLAGDIFLANKYRALPIVEDEQLIGIITVHDLLAYSFAEALDPSDDDAFDENTIL